MPIRGIRNEWKRMAFAGDVPKLTLMLLVLPVT